MPFNASESDSETVISVHADGGSDELPVVRVDIEPPFSIPYPRFDTKSTETLLAMSINSRFVTAIIAAHGPSLSVDEMLERYCRPMLHQLIRREVKLNAG